jgi:hypothetical protein
VSYQTNIHSRLMLMAHARKWDVVVFPWDYYQHIKGYQAMRMRDGKSLWRLGMGNAVKAARALRADR